MLKFNQTLWKINQFSRTHDQCHLAYRDRCEGEITGYLFFSFSNYKRNVNIHYFRTYTKTEEKLTRWKAFSFIRIFAWLSSCVHNSTACLYSKYMTILLTKLFSFCLTHFFKNLSSKGLFAARLCPSIIRLTLTNCGIFVGRVADRIADPKTTGNTVQR